MRILVGIVIIACLASDIHAQTINQIIMDPESGEEVLYGRVTWDAFRKPPFAEWFEEEYHGYGLDTEIIEVLDRNVLGTWFVSVVMGSWCSDSRRELPRFYKIWEELGLNADAVTIIGVDTKKACPDGMTDSLAIERVPTFIFYQCNMELGRIVESPEESLEKELFRILYTF